MERVELDVSIREAGGSRTARRLRAGGNVPAVVYGSGIGSVNLVVDGRVLERIVARGSNPLVDLRGPKPVGGKLALIKEVQRDPVSHALLHCDFLAVDTSKKITVSVPLQFTGKPAGVEMGGVLEPVLREIEVTCLPLAIPDSIAVDVSPLEIGQGVHLGDLAMPAGVEFEGDVGLTVVHVVAPRVEEAPAAPAEGEAAPAAAAEPTAEPAESGS